MTSQQKKDSSRIRNTNLDKEIEIIKQLGRIRTFFIMTNMDLLVEDQQFRGHDRDGASTKKLK